MGLLKSKTNIIDDKRKKFYYIRGIKNENFNIRITRIFI